MLALFGQSDPRQTTLQFVSLPEIPLDEDYMSLARSAMLSRVSFATTQRAQVVYTWQKFARSEEEVGWLGVCV